MTGFILENVFAGMVHTMCAMPLFLVGNCIFMVYTGRLISLVASITVIAGTLTSVNAQENSFQPLKAKIIRDEVFKASPVSGEWLVGAHWKGAGKAAKRPSLFVRIPPRMAGGKICASGVSITGLYQAVFEYDIPGHVKPDAVPLEFPTKYIERVQNYDINSSGIVIQKGSCNNPEPVFIASYWNERPRGKKPSTLILNINSGNSDEVFAYFGAKAKRPVKCSQVTSMSKIAFDYQCRFQHKGKWPDKVVVEVQRFRNGRENRPMFATLVFAGQ